jgi:hypothetical protein
LIHKKHKNVIYFQYKIIIKSIIFKNLMNKYNKYRLLFLILIINILIINWIYKIIKIIKYYRIFNPLIIYIYRKISTIKHSLRMIKIKLFIPFEIEKYLRGHIYTWERYQELKLLKETENYLTASLHSILYLIILFPNDNI